MTDPAGRAVIAAEHVVTPDGVLVTLTVGVPLAATVTTTDPKLDPLASEIALTVTGEDGTAAGA